MNLVPATTTFLAKYKPYFFRDFFLEEAHMNILKMMMAINDFNILIVGGPSCGKTSLLHAIIREYYGLKRDDVFPEHNIMFINNLKEQGIQYFRNEMKTFCQSYSNIHGKKKFIVIDDIDNVNEQSQQVFRNYIDKYSNHIHFIAVCTNIQKVNESLQSRLPIIKLGNIQLPHVEQTMHKILRCEGMRLDAEAQAFLLSYANQSIRVMINFLEKIYIYCMHLPSDHVVTLAETTNLCSNISYGQLARYVEALQAGRKMEATRLLYEIYDYGYSVIDILNYFFLFLKQTELLSETEKYDILPHLCKYITIFHKVHEDPIELALFTNSIYVHVLRCPRS